MGNATHFFTLTIFVSAALTKIWKGEAKKPSEEFKEKKKFYKVEKIYSKVDGLSMLYLFVCSVLAMIPFVISFNAKYASYMYEMVKKVEVVSSIVIGLTTIAITMAVVVILFDKGYYIVFSIREVLQKYKFSECMIMVIFSCIVVSGITMTLLNEKLDSIFDVGRFMILEIATVYNVVGVAYILSIICSIMFLERKKELCLLRQLYKRFWHHRIDTTHFKDKKNWNKVAVRINIEYLIERYMKICRRRRIARIKELEFVTTMECYEEKWYRKARKKFILMMVIFLMGSTIINWCVLKEDCLAILLINTIATIVSVIFAYTNVKCFRIVITRLYSDKWGYYIHMCGDKELFVPEVALRIDNVYDTYFKRMNSLNAFFYIWINYVNKKNDVIKNGFEEVILGFYELQNKNMITFLPIFTIGFFLYDEKI